MALGTMAGSLCQYVALPADAVAVVPVGVTAEAAAMTGLAGVAALDSVDALDLQPGDTLLVSGATGGVGNIAIQLAAAAGATVIDSGKPAAQADYVTGLGAHHVVDWTGDLAAQVKAIAPEGVDKALHAAGDPADLGATLRPGAIVASTLAADNHQLGREDVTAVPIMAAATGDKVARLLERVAAGGLRVNVETSVALDQAADAHAASAAGTLGKVLITVK